MLPTIAFDTSDFTLVAASMAADAVQLDAKARLATRHFGLLLQTKVKAYASKPRSGPPGPRIQTGDYNRSISLTMGGNAFFSAATVGTNKPQGRRLEYGFVGADSLGRVYHQPPYPHFRPALWEVRPLFVAALAALAGGGP